MPDPIGWQLERKQRERRGERRERAGKARAAEPGRGARGGQGKKMQVRMWARVLEERRETREGRWKGELEIGGGQSFMGVWVGSGLKAGVASPFHTRWSLTHHQAVHPQLQTQAQPPMASFFCGSPIFQPPGPGHH